MSSSQQVGLCAAYETFGICKFGKDCLRSHNVWPYGTRSARATIVTEDIKLPGVIAFLIESNDASQQYYISRGQWFSAGASTGDRVEILISDQVHQGSGCSFARITEIIESASTTRILPPIPVGLGEQGDCFDFMTFRDCRRGERCKYTHKVSSAYTQRFHVAKVLSVNQFKSKGFEVHVDVKSDQVNPGRANGRPKIYYAQAKISCDVREGNLVILQESSRLQQYKRNCHFGKVIAILHESQGLGESEVAVEVCAKPGFMFVQSYDSDGLQRTPVNAYSVESCPHHENCRRIGVHIRSAGLDVHFKRLNQYFVPYHREDERNLPNGFEVDTIRLALTLYFHSSSEDVEGPYITPVLIDSDSAYKFTLNDAPKYQQYLKHMWPVFGAKSFIGSVVNSFEESFMMDFPKTWKERYVIRQAAHSFNREIARYMQSKEGKFVIVRNNRITTGIKAQDIVIPAENLEMVKSAWQSLSAAPDSFDEKEIALGCMLGSVKRCAEEFWEEQQLFDRYALEVVSCENIQDHQTVVTTSPIAQTVDFLNQQTVLSLMISPLASLYSKNDILGCINPRYPTPVMLKAVISKLTKTVVSVQLRGIYGRRLGDREIRLEEIFKCPVVSIEPPSTNDSDAGESVLVDKISLLIEDLNSEEYCNSKLVRLAGDQIATLYTTAIEQGLYSDKTGSEVRGLLVSHEEYVAPYQVHEKGTLVTLTRGVELQLQILLKEDDKDDSDHCLRLLRVGKDCHRCLLHWDVANQGHFAGRGDAASLIPRSSLKLMHEKIVSNGLRTVILKDVAIEWNDWYFSGGTFTAETPIKPRHLLCIRKEIVGNDDHSIFVWTCHAVVSEARESQIRFLICSLFQDLTPEIWAEIENARFIVEVIDTDEENGSDK